MPTSSLNLLCQPFAAFAAKWQKLVRIAGNPYRPERHYMRGKGPKWQARHGTGRSEAR